MLHRPPCICALLNTKLVMGKMQCRNGINMPEPIYYHIDVNSAFLSWEAAYRVLILGEKEDLRDIPSAVGGSQRERHGIILAKSVPAKKYGIQTGEPLISARNKCPGLVIVPPNYELYVNCSKGLLELLKKYTPCIHQYSIDEAFCDMTGAKKLTGSPVIFAGQLKEEIKETLGFTVNIGISSNKLLAKMASDFRKPDRVHTLFPEEIPLKMWPLPVTDLFFVGRATAKTLRTLGITTIGDLAGTDPSILKSHLKKTGEIIWNYANGKDISLFLKEHPKNKGYGNSMTVPYDIEDSAQAKQVLLSLCETVCARLRADYGKISCVGVSIVNNDFCQTGSQMVLKEPTDITLEVYQTACHIFFKRWNRIPVRQLGVYTSKVSYSNTEYQYPLFNANGYEKYARLDMAIDQVRKKYGEDIIMRASFLNSRISHMNGGIDKAKRTGVTKGI